MTHSCDRFLSSVLSVVTLLLLPHAQGNIWLFEDSVLITGKRPGTSGGTRLEGRGRPSVDINCSGVFVFVLIEIYGILLIGKLRNCVLSKC